MVYGDDDPQVESNILRETRVGSKLNDENPKKGVISVPVIINRGEEEYLGRRVIPGDGGMPMTKPL